MLISSPKKSTGLLQSLRLGLREGNTHSQGGRGWKKREIVNNYFRREKEDSERRKGGKGTSKPGVLREEGQKTSKKIDVAETLKTRYLGKKGGGRSQHISKYLSRGERRSAAPFGI